MMGKIVLFKINLFSIDIPSEKFLVLLFAHFSLGLPGCFLVDF
jgi:hypothetical protein